MSKNKIEINNNIIEVQNSWLGFQTIIINSQIVSKKYSIEGADHFFTLLEEGRQVPYVLTTKIRSKSQLLSINQILIDIKREGIIIRKNVLISFSVNQNKESNKQKIQGIKLLREYEIKEAIQALEQGLAFDNDDSEIYFFLACCYSIEEKAKDGFEFIRLAIEKNFDDLEMIHKHEMLAFLRIHSQYEAFLNSGFTKYNFDKLGVEK